jgi:hypothetical protein
MPYGQPGPRVDKEQVCYGATQLPRKGTVAFKEQSPDDTTPVGPNDTRKPFTVCFGVLRVREVFRHHPRKPSLVTQRVPRTNLL